MPLEFLSVGVLGILILGIFVPYWLKTKDLKKLITKKGETFYIPKYKPEYKKQFRIDTIKIKNHERKL